MQTTLKRKRVPKNLNRVISNPEFTKSNPVSWSNSPKPRASLSNTPDVDLEIYKTKKETSRGSHILSLQIPKTLKRISQKSRNNLNIYKSYPSPSRKSTPSTMSQISNEQTKLLSIKKENKSLKTQVSKLENEIAAIMHENTNLAKHETKLRLLEDQIQRVSTENEILRKKSTRNLDKVMEEFKIKLANKLEKNS